VDKLRYLLNVVLVSWFLTTCSLLVIQSPGSEPKLSSQLRPYLASGLFSRYFFQKNILQGPFKTSLFKSEYNEAKQVNSLRITIAIETVFFIIVFSLSLFLSVFVLFLLFLSFLSFFLSRFDFLTFLSPYIFLFTNFHVFLISFVLCIQARSYMESRHLSELFSMLFSTLGAACLLSGSQCRAFMYKNDMSIPMRELR
jgi:hypothetical protein